MYFTSVLTLSQTLWLEGVYYIWVALTEVPSGYFSDRFGRKKTLMLSSLCLAVAYLLFFLGNSFVVFALAQIFMAAGFAFSSGTDAAFHYESLENLNRRDEYAKKEAKALRYSFLAAAMGALIGGGLAVYNLKWIYGASFFAALASLVIVGFMIEPQRGKKSLPPPMLQQVCELFKRSWNHRFRFFTIYAIAMTVLIHFPYEFYQPYLEKVTLSMGGTTSFTPGITGIHLAVTMGIGSWFTKFAGRVHHRCRVRILLIFCAFVQLILMGAMALVIHPVVVVLLMGRTALKAISTPLINAELAPLLKSSERGTYLSLQSLLGRVCYGMILFVLPFGSSFFSNQLQGNLVSALGVGSLLLAFVVTAPFTNDTSHHCCSDHPHPAVHKR